ncbi:MAG: hypothetical protein U9N19_08435 [Thermodesulfobacteriota bacterium]|nr:hypothetical protein [Thermodesulfobacteriota bacterium]
MTHWCCRISQAQSYACKALSAVTSAVYKLKPLVPEIILTGDIAGHLHSLWSVLADYRLCPKNITLKYGEYAVK